jgi:hypothetical protein
MVMNLRNEFARRYTPRDWLISSKVNKLIGQINADEVISEVIDDGAPALVGRLGGTEGRFIGEYLKMQRYEKFGLEIPVAASMNFRWKKRKKEVGFNAGYVPGDWVEIQEFVTLYQQCLVSTDIIGAWGTSFAWAESIAVKSPRNPSVIPIGHTTPWVDPVNRREWPTPWSMHLEGKKVLVIAGFAESIMKQHQRTSQIFNSDPYPKFQLEVIKAPLSAGRDSVSVNNWFENLGTMELQMSIIDFDIALISAGAYSYPLALKAKELGKIGIHCGGGLQLFFGIMGGRWENDSIVRSKLNEYWIRPSRDETPENAKGVEGGCYW